MKITTLSLTFEKTYTFEQMYRLIFYPKINEKVSPILKCFRRYRTYMIGLHYESDNKFSFSFTFPNREILFDFREEFTEASKEVPK